MEQERKGPSSSPGSALCSLCPSQGCLDWAGSSEVLYHPKPAVTCTGHSIHLSSPVVGFNSIFWILIVSLLCS